MRLYLARHGETDWNAAQRFQGWSDIPLNEVGRKQAAALADRLSVQYFDVVYCSDLQRAIETAKMIVKLSDCKPNLHSDPRLREVHFGDWEGLTYDAIKEKYPEVLTAWENDIYKTARPMAGRSNNYPYKSNPCWMNYWTA